MNYLAEAKKWKQEAEQILAESKLLDQLKKYGQAVFTGSYTYDLMLNADIDIYLITPKNTKETAKKLLSDLVNSGWWNGYMLFDWVKWWRDDFPNGYYVGTKTFFNDHRWKVDIWVLDKFPTEQKKYNDWLISSLNAENRQKILELKTARNEYGWETYSKTIYDAVLKEGIETVSDFKDKILAQK